MEEVCYLNTNLTTIDIDNETEVKLNSYKLRYVSECKLGILFDALQVNSSSQRHSSITAIGKQR